MLNLKNLTEKLPQSNKEGKKDHLQDASELKVTQISASKRYQLGRHLSFAIDEISVQMVAVSCFGTNIRIIDVSKAYIPRDDMSGDLRYNFLSTIIEEYIRTNGGYLPRISVTLTTGDIAFRAFLMPMLKKSSLDSAIGFEVRKQIPYPQDNCIFDFRITDHLVTKDRTRCKIALYASTMRNVYEQLKPFSPIGAEVSKVYHSQEVLGYLLERLPDFSPDKNYTLLSIAKGNSTISFYRGTELQFFHVGTPGATVLTSTPDQTQIEYFSESLVDEIGIAFDYYSGQYSGNITSEILVYGDLSYRIDLIEGLDSNIAYQFRRFPVEQLDFAANCDESLQISMSVCLPALAAAICGYKTANLLPEEKRRQIKTKKWIQYGKTTLAIAIVCLSLGWAAVSDQVKTEKVQLQELQHQVAAFENSPAYHTYNNLKRQIAENRLYLDRAKQGKAFLGLSLKELSLITPKSIKLLHYHLTPKKGKDNLSLQGIVTSRNIPPELILAEFVESLSSSPFFEGVRIVRHVKKPLEEGFEIEFAIQLESVV